MKYGIHTPTLWKVLSIVALGVLITCASGCKFGKKVNPNSNGIISVTRPSSGTWLKPDGIDKSLPIQIKPPKSEPVKMTNRIAKITLPKGESVSGTSKPSPVRSIGKPIKLEPSQVELLMPKLHTSDPVKIKMNVIPAKESESGKEVIEIVAVEEKGGSFIKWSELLAFYFIAALVAFLAWIGYGLYKEQKKVKNKWQDSFSLKDEDESDKK